MSAAASSQPRPNTKGSPPFRRRTRRPARARSISRSLISRCCGEGRPPRLPAADQLGVRRAAERQDAADRPARRARCRRRSRQGMQGEHGQQPRIAGPGAGQPDLARRKVRQRGKIGRDSRAAAPEAALVARRRTAHCRGSRAAPSTLPTRISAVRSIGWLGDLGRDRAERGADDALVGPARAIDDGDGAVGAVVRQQRVPRPCRGHGWTDGWRASRRSPQRPPASRPAASPRRGPRCASAPPICATSGRVSSWPSAAAAAAKDGTPGVTV